MKPRARLSRNLEPNGVREKGKSRIGTRTDTADVVVADDTARRNSALDFSVVPKSDEGHGNPSKAMSDHVDEDDLGKRKVIDSMARSKPANRRFWLSGC